MENLINKKKRKDTEVTFNHDEESIPDAIIGIENIINKADKTMDDLISKSFNKKTEIIEYLYNIDKIELALIAACVIENLSEQNNKK